MQVCSQKVLASRKTWIGTINWTDFLRSYNLVKHEGALYDRTKTTTKPRNIQMNLKATGGTISFGKRRCDICREYDIATSCLTRMGKEASTSGSFHEKDNRPGQEELIRLRKKPAVKTENDILKTSGADPETKVNVIKANAHKIPVSAMCRTHR